MNRSEPTSTAHRVREFASEAAAAVPPPPPSKPEPRPVPRVRVEGVKGLCPKPEPHRETITQDELRLIRAYRAPRRWRDQSPEELTSFRAYPGETS